MLQNCILNAIKFDVLTSGNAHFFDSRESTTSQAGILSYWYDAGNYLRYSVGTQTSSSELVDYGATTDLSHYVATCSAETCYLIVNLPFNILILPFTTIILF